MKSKTLGIFVAVLCLLGVTGLTAAQEILLNPGFETWTAGPGGPPDSWSLNGSGQTATQEATIKHGGTYSVNSTWTNTETIWLEQEVAVSAGYAYTLSGWRYDNDPDGRGRFYIRWYDAAHGYLSSFQDNDYTVDSAEWQYDDTGSQTAPPGAAYAHCELRLYDVTGWDGDATMYWDDISFQQTGTPPPPDTLTIAQVQFNNATPGTGDNCYPSPQKDSVVVIEGVVTAINRSYKDNFYLQDADSLWSGVYCFDTNVYPNRGDRLRLTAQVQEYYGMTEMGNAIVDSISAGNPMPTIYDLEPADLDTDCTAASEPYEGMLVRIQDVTCIETADEYGQWWVSDGFEVCEVEDGCWHYEPNIGEQFDYIIGVVTWSFGHYELNPRDEFDIPPRPAFAGITHMPTLPNSSQPVTVMASIYETGSSKAILGDTLYYKANGGGAWNKVQKTSVEDNYYYYTIPARSDGDTVYFNIHADNGAAVKSSPTLKYWVTDEPPLLMINEIMYDSPGTDTLTFVELYGSAGFDLTDFELVGINGDDGSSYAIIDLSGYNIPLDQYMVIGQDANVTNVDVIDPLADFQNGSDNIVLRKGGIIYDAVGYGTFGAKQYFKGETWPTYDPNSPYTGSSIGRDPDHADTDYNRQDFGVYPLGHTTPGTANTPAAAYTIQQIQQVVKQDESPHLGERVSVSGVVSGLTPYDGYYIGEAPGGPWHGILVYDLFNEPARGNNVTVKGTVQEEYGRTQIGFVSNYTDGGAGTIPDPYPTSTANVSSDESLEGVLVQVHEVTVVDTLNYGEFWVTDGVVEDTCVVDDIFGYAYQPVPGDHRALLRGLVDYSFDDYKIQPRDDDDFILYAPANLNITKSGDDLYLQWNRVGEALYYVIYRFINPTDPGDSLIATSEYDTTFVLTEPFPPPPDHYYEVEARYYTGEKAVYGSRSRMVGAFDRDLVKVK